MPQLAICQSVKEITAFCLQGGSSASLLSLSVRLEDSPTAKARRKKTPGPKRILIREGLEFRIRSCTARRLAYNSLNAAIGDSLHAPIGYLPKCLKDHRLLPSGWFECKAQENSRTEAYLNTRGSGVLAATQQSGHHEGKRRGPGFALPGPRRHLGWFSL